jgi:hypothetical protein
MNLQKVVSPVALAKARVHKLLIKLDSGFRRNDEKRYFLVFCELIKNRL